jgi:hypothetical protein
MAVLILEGQNMWGPDGAIFVKLLGVPVCLPLSLYHSDFLLRLDGWVAMFLETSIFLSLDPFYKDVWTWLVLYVMP